MIANKILQQSSKRRSHTHRTANQVSESSRGEPIENHSAAQTGSTQTERTDRCVRPGTVTTIKAEEGVQQEITNI